MGCEEKLVVGGPDPRGAPHVPTEEKVEVGVGDVLECTWRRGDRRTFSSGTWPLHLGLGQRTGEDGDFLHHQARCLT